MAVEPLLNPEAHYALAGPQAITFEEVAATIAAVSGRPVAYLDVDQETWINGAIAAGVPADYAVMLRWLTGAIITGNGSTPTHTIEASSTGQRPASRLANRNAAVWATSEDK